MEFNETSPPTVVEYDDDFLKNMSDSDYVDFVAQFLKPTPIEYIFVGIYLCLVSFFPKLPQKFKNFPVFNWNRWQLFGRLCGLKEQSNGWLSMIFVKSFRKQPSLL